MTKISGQAISKAADRATPRKQSVAPTTPIFQRQDNVAPFNLHSAQEEKGSKSNPAWIALPPRELADWVAYSVNCALLLVGMGAVIAAVRTLDAIKRQANLMQRQAEEMVLQRVATQDTLAAIRRQADLMTEQNATAERAIVLQFRPRILLRGGLMGEGENATFMLTNTGGSNAYIVDFFLSVKPSKGSGYSQLLPGGERQVVEEVMVAGEMRTHYVNLGVTGDHMAAQELVEQITFVCLGYLKYKDDLDIVRLTSFFRRFNSNNFRFEAVTNSDWEYADSRTDRAYNYGQLSFSSIGCS